MVEQPIDQKRRYLSYLLRLWQENGGDLLRGEPPLWRATLESPQSDERQGFASLADLVAYLENETGSGFLDSQRQEEEKKGGGSHG